MTNPDPAVWKGSALVETFLQGVRAAIPQAQDQIDVMLRLLSAAARPVRNVLDLGCGDGVLAAAILKHFPDSRAVLVDFSEPMLDAARARFASEADRVHIQAADYGDPSWTRAIEDAAPFDAVVSGFSIHHQPDTRKREVYAEIYSLLGGGGFFINIEHVASATPWLRDISDNVIIDSLHRFHSDKTREEVAATFYHRPDKAANILASVELQCQWLREIGFNDVDCYLKIFEMTVFGGRKP